MDYVDLLFMILKRLNESIVFFFLLVVETTSLFPIGFFFNANTCFVWFPLISLHV